MKTTNALQRIAAGMLTFSLVVMFAVLGFGLTKPVWAAQMDAVCSVTYNGETTYYDDLYDVPFYAWGDDSTIDNPVVVKMLKDYTRNNNRLLNISSNDNARCYVLDLNGHILNISGVEVSWKVTLNIKDSNPKQKHYFKMQDNYHVFDDTLTEETADGVINGGVLTPTIGNSRMNLIAITNNTKVIVDGGTFIQVGSDDNYACVILYGGSSFTMNGGQLINKNKNAIMDYNKDSYWTKSIVINSGDVHGGIDAREEDVTMEETNFTITTDEYGKTHYVAIKSEPEPEPEPEPSTDVEIKDDNQDKNENNFPWAGVIIGGVAVTATVAAVAVACLAVRRK